MDKDLLKLYNTLMLVETKGESTKTMAQCLVYLNQLIIKCNAENKTKLETKASEEGGE